MALPVSILEDVDTPLSAAVKLASAANELYAQVAGASLSCSQWLANTWAPEYLAADSFRLAGDLADQFPAGRALRCHVNAGPLAAQAAGAAFDGEHTVVTLGQAVLDETFFAVEPGILTPGDSALPGDVARTGGAAFTGPVSLIAPVAVDQAARRGDLSPVGAVVLWPAEAFPAGWLPLDGAELAVADYPELFAVLGASYGGDGQDTFRLPDARGLFPRFPDGGSDRDPDAAQRTARPDGAAGGAVGTTQADELARHGHTVYGVTVPYTPGGSEVRALSASSQNDVPSSEAGGSETRPANIYLWPIIKAKQGGDA